VEVASEAGVGSNAPQEYPFPFKQQVRIDASNACHTLGLSFFVRQGEKMIEKEVKRHAAAGYNHFCANSNT
jgi:hypothetical protein